MNKGLKIFGAMAILLVIALILISSAVFFVDSEIGDSSEPAYISLNN